MITKLPHASFETTTQKLLHTSYEAATLCTLITVNSSKAQPITVQHEQNTLNRMLHNLADDKSNQTCQEQM